jgi:hypothetical protein
VGVTACLFLYLYGYELNDIGMKTPYQWEREKDAVIDKGVKYWTWRILVIFSILWVILLYHGICRLL